MLKHGLLFETYYLKSFAACIKTTEGNRKRLGNSFIYVWLSLSPFSRSKETNRLSKGFPKQTFTIYLYTHTQRRTPSHTNSEKQANTYGIASAVSLTICGSRAGRNFKLNIVLVKISLRYFSWFYFIIYRIKFERLLRWTYVLFPLSDEQRCTARCNVFIILKYSPKKIA